MESVDVAIIGAGFGGLGAALPLAEAGLDVVVYESLNYPGGCASSFERFGHRYTTGATMYAGFGPNGWMRGWIDRYGLPDRTRPLDPVIELRDGEHQLVLAPSREEFVEQLARLPDAPSGLHALFQEIERSADTLWALFDDPAMLPPFSVRSLAGHATRLHRYLGLLPGLGRPLSSRVHAHGASGFEPLRRWLDAACQITVQLGADQAEAPVAMAAIDFFWRGTVHLDGGIGAFARDCTDAIERLGGQVRFTDRVRRLERDGDGWIVHSRRGSVRAHQVVANLLPQDVDRLLGVEPEDALVTTVRRSWGAGMLYLRGRLDGLDDGPHHLQLIADPSRPFVEGNLVLVSADPDDGDGRSITVSTHMPIVPPDETAALTERVHAAMRSTLASRLPELHIDSELTASPRTFERFTRREQGRVGGPPRVAGLHNYRQLWPVQRQPGVWLVGDSVFPGQSVLAVAIGGNRVATTLLRGALSRPATGNARRARSDRRDR